MLHKPAAQSGKDPASGYKTRLGVVMFVIYALVYGGFVAINVASPLSMENKVFAGLNLAVVYGIGLIVFALILALIYERMCAIREQQLEGTEDGGQN